MKLFADDERPEYQYVDRAVYCRKMALAAVVCLACPDEQEQQQRK
mgnify:CR=1 FL=1